MKKIIMILIILLMPICLYAGTLDSKQYSVTLEGTEYTLIFGKDTVTLQDTLYTYTYSDPLGTINGVPFYILGDTLVLVMDSITLIDSTPAPPPPPQPTDPIDLSKVKWLHTNVSTWPITANLKPIKFSSTTITLDYDKACVWPGVNIDGIDLNANPWIFVNLDGIWYGATWEWMRVCQITKNLYAVNGDHIKVPPLDTWSPVSGETYYFMVSGLARQNQRNVKERSNMVKVIWP
jgi:hypothetical protein